MSRKQRARYLSSGQKEILIEFLEDHKHLRSGKFNSNFTFRQAQMLWQQLATKLNSVPGSRKDWRQWRKTWQDIRTKTKYKQASIYKLNIESMKANIPIESLTPIEERIVTIIENDTKSAHRETKEYSTSVGTQDAPIIETKLEMIDDIDEFQQGCEGIDEFEEKYQPKELNHPEIIGIFEEQTGTQVLKVANIKVLEPQF
ncbi:uncharacterized protein [Diabrotica undecimpunctata]|uniref:uncharacterized protein isoform X2 n=1 Tax=Diabrotica undecimpunctata TaxID=50387 RepID=UPI003B639AA7